jgi:hypothetical protein
MCGSDLDNGHEHGPLGDYNYLCDRCELKLLQQDPKRYPLAAEPTVAPQPKVKTIDHASMTARGCMSACARALKAAGLPLGKHKQVLAGGFGTRGETVQGFHLSRVGLSELVALDWIHPLEHYCYGSRPHQAAMAEKKAKLSECRAVLEKHGVKFDHRSWIKCLYS